MDEFEGCDHLFDFLKLLLKCAPMVKRMIVRLSYEVPAREDKLTQIHNIFRAYFFNVVLVSMCFVCNMDILVS